MNISYHIYIMYKTPSLNILSGIIRINKANWLLDESHSNHVNNNNIIIISENIRYKYPLKIICTYNTINKTISYPWIDNFNVNNRKICSKIIQNVIDTNIYYNDVMHIYRYLLEKLDFMNGIVYSLKIKSLNNLYIFTYLENINNYRFKRVISIEDRHNIVIVTLSNK